MTIARTLRMIALAGLLATPALAGELAWVGSADEREAVLSLKDPGTGHRPLEFWCNAEVDIVYVAWYFRPATSSEGMEASFTLSAGGIVIPVGAIGYNIENDNSFVLEGQISFDQIFRDFISATGTLTAQAEGKTEIFSLEGAREAAKPLLRMCGRERG